MYLIFSRFYLLYFFFFLFLIEISRDILRFKDADGKYLLGKIRDTAGQVSNITQEKEEI
jgi:hypothetical protein